MNRYSLYITGIALALAGCSADDEPGVASADEIRFTVASDSAGSRVGGMTSSLEMLQNDKRGIGVTAVYNGDNSKNYFSNLKFTYSKYSNCWTSQPVYPWPSTGSLEFIGYFPYNKDINPWESYYKRLAFNSYVIKENVKEHDDLMVARTKSTKAQAVASAPRLKFHHMLANLNVEINKTNERIHMRVYAVGLFNINCRGSLKITPSDLMALDESSPSSSDYTDVIMPCWTLGTSSSLYNKYLYVRPDNNPVCITISGQTQLVTGKFGNNFIRFPMEDNYSFMIIPQTVHPWQPSMGNKQSGTWIGLLASVSLQQDPIGLPVTDEDKSRNGKAIGVFPTGGNPKGHIALNLTNEELKEIKYAWLAVPLPADSDGNFVFRPGCIYTIRLMLGYNGGGVGYMAPQQPEIPTDYNLTWSDVYKADSRPAGESVLGGPIKVEVIETNSGFVPPYRDDIFFE